jgi:demethylmenaquinone methyltransferase/2-methoxy-6-polyprenyl-1,4-benzoquinol methylase
LRRASFGNGNRWLSSTDGTWAGSTQFGFQQVASPDDKTDRVRQVFRSVADQYDLMNDLMSVGIHRLWKDSFVESLKLKAPMNVLDVAGGTGDIAFRCVAHLGNQTRGPNELFPSIAPSTVTVVDINENMLQVGIDRATQANLYPSTEDHHCSLKFLVGNAEDLADIPDCSQDVYTIAFGLRNVARIPLALKEAFRVLKPGGRFACMEFSQVDIPVLDKLYEAYSFNVIPEVGRAVTGDRDSYQYLVESIAKFPKRHELKEMLVEAGFNRDLINVETMSGGVVAVHSSFRI